jgi:uncharacterized protein (TIGR02646 family)
MNWFAGEIPTGIELREERKKYLLVSHGTKKHVAETNLILAEMFQRARAKKQDLWGELGDLAKVTAHGEILGSSIKAAFRKQLLKVQNGRCCYCRRWLVSTAYAKPIDHILPKDTYPQFSVDFWNLAVSCSDCNLHKSNTVWGAIKVDRRSYPRPSEFEDSYHPRFHHYDDHISYLRYESNKRLLIAYVGLTPQGRQLCSSLLHVVAAKESFVANNPVLKPTMDSISGFGARANAQQLARFEDFQKALDRSALRFLEKTAST